jgi:NAD+ diphosphatase
MKFCPQCGNQLRAREIDGATRWVCQADDCQFIHWNNPVPVVAALVRYQDNYIIARNAKWPEGIFSLITGYLESGEDPEQAALREVQEELNLSGGITQFLGHYTFKQKNQLILAYEIKATGELQTNYELAELKQLTPAELASYDFHPLVITTSIINEWVRTLAPKRQ